jgi:CHAD domain-containing protein
MKLRLPRGKAAGERLKSVLLRLARQAQGDIEELGQDPAGRIHDLRTGMKKYRALLRLAGCAMKKPMRGAMRDRAAWIKDAMAGARDEHVVHGAIHRVLGEDAVARLGVRPPRIESGSHAPEPLHLAAAELVALTEALDVSTLDESNFKKAWRRTRRRARKAMKAAAKTGAAGDFHAWRKRAKELWYQSEALECLDDDISCARKPAEELSDLLGDEHDLTITLETVRGLTRGDRARLRAARDRARESALHAGKSLL